MDPDISFGHWLHWRRRTLDLTQDALARRVGCSVITIRKLEADERRPSAQIAARLADSLQVPAADRVTLVAFARAGPPLDPSFASPDGSLPWRAPPRPTSNLPAPLTRLIGRKPEVAAVRNALRRGDLRLLTLIGPPGIGKTRLGFEVAAEVRDAFADGVYFVALAPISDPTLVTATIAKTLGLRETGDQPLDILLRQYLCAKRLLVLLDNCEHLASAAPDVVALLEACPRLQILATSRAALHVQGERLIPVPPLTLPTLAPLPALPALAHTPAVALFIERAQAVQPSFALTEQHAPAVAAICARLEGLPLAIELVAAQINRFTPQALLEGLDHQLTLLAEGSRDLPPRHQSLRAAIAWSDDLLTLAEQRLFRRLSVFARGATLEAAEAVCAAPAGAEALSADLLDTLGTLVDHNLVWRQEETDGGFRFGLLHVIREYALERLEASGEAEALRQAHAVYYLGLVGERPFAVYGPAAKVWLERLEREHDNFRVALSWARERGEVDLGLRLAASLGPFWYVRGYFTEGRGRLEGMLALTPQFTEDGSRERAGDGASEVGEPDVSVAARAEALAAVSNLAWVQEDIERAFAAATTALELARDRREDWAGWTAGTALHLLGQIAWGQGDLERAAAYLEESVVRLRAVGQEGIATSFLTLVGLIALDLGDLERARARCEESLAFAQRTGSDHPEGFALACLADVARRRGDLARARLLGREALLIWQRLSAPSHIAGGMEGLARTVAMVGETAQTERASRLLGAAAALREQVGVSQGGRARAHMERDLAQAREALGEQRWMAAFVAGGELTIEEAIAEALSADG